MSRYILSHILGRPPVPKNKQRIRKFQLCLTDEEYESLKKVAREHAFNVSDYVRWKLGLKTIL